MSGANTEDGAPAREPGNQRGGGWGADRAPEPAAGPAPMLGAEPGWVDAHAHIFHPEMIARRVSYLSRDDRFASLYRSPRALMANADEVVAEMDHAGVAQSIVFGFPFHDQGLCRMVNDYVLEAVAARPDRLAGIACVSPGERGAVAELERCLDAGLRGCGELAPSYSPEDLVRLAGVAAVLRERGLPLLLHANEPVGHQYPGKSDFGPAACVACATAYPGVKLVFAHMGGGTFLYEAMSEVRKVLADAYYDTSAVPYLYEAGIYQAAEATAGAHKVLFGSDYALLSPARYREGLNVLSRAARTAVCGDNARKVFKL
jgi:predicted TIM-barrel fold metal-dependent hydrolase